MEQQIFCVYSGMACGHQTLGVRSPFLQTGADRPGLELTRVCLGVGPSPVGNLAMAVEERVFAGCLFCPLARGPHCPGVSERKSPSMGSSV